MKISFLGGTGTVTGSKYLLDLKSGQRILIDCGLFQGLKELRLRNREPFPVDPASIDVVVLTHAHIDHSGYLPALVRDGFSGEILCTDATKALCEILLLDCGYLQEEEARFANKRGFSKHRPAVPLYTGDDAKKTLPFISPLGIGERTEITEGVFLTFRRAGHILGAASTLVEADGVKILLSGDIGRSNDPILLPPEPAVDADYIVMESTYGNRLHSKEDPETRLAGIINRTVDRQGVVLMPAFAVGRTQNLLFHLMRLKVDKRIPDVPVFLNSPMAIRVTDVFCDHRGEHQLGPDLCHAVCEVAKYVRTVDESKQLNERKGPMIIVSANGMISGGRILHHIHKFGPDARTSIILPGYQAVGTRGRSLQDGAKFLRMFGEDVPIRAEIETMEGLSAHADATELVQWVQGVSRAPKRIFITHGEPEAASALKERITRETGFKSEVPELGQVVTL